MAVTMAQKAAGFGWNATTLNLSYSGSVSAGSGLVACISRENGAYTISSVSDSVNSTWTEAVQRDGSNPGANDQGIFYFPNSASGTPTTTTTASGTSMITTHIFECTGLDTSTPLADTSSGTGTTGTVDPGSVTPTVADNIVFAVAVNTNALSAKSGYTDGYFVGNNYYEGSQYKITASTSAENPTFGGTPNGWTSACAVFQAAGGGAFTLTADAGSYSVSGTAAGLLATRLLTALTSSYTLSGTNAGVFVGRYISAGVGSYSVSGTDVTLQATRTMTADAGTYTLTGQDAGLLYGRYLSAGSGVYTVTGQDVTTLATRLITASGGSYTLSGTDATLTYAPITSDYALTAEAGGYVLSGGEAGLLATRLLAMGEGSYIVTGQVLQLLKGYLLSAEAGGYVATGADATFLRTYNLSADPGSYTIIGKDVILSYSEQASGGHFILLRRRRRLS